MEKQGCFEGCLRKLVGTLLHTFHLASYFPTTAGKNQQTKQRVAGDPLYEKMRLSHLLENFDDLGSFHLLQWEYPLLELRLAIVLPFSPSKGAQETHEAGAKRPRRCSDSSLPFLIILGTDELACQKQGCFRARLAELLSWWFDGDASAWRRVGVYGAQRR